MGIGEWAALTAALLWTFSSMLWGRIHLSAININLWKNIIGTLLVATHLVVLATFANGTGLEASTRSWFWLGLSGLVGVVIGDTLYFRSLQILGPRLALMVATTGPIFSVVLGWLFLHEVLLTLAIAGIFITVGGVVVVVADRKAAREAPGLMPGRIRIGLAAGTGGAICQAIGGVFSKLGMRDSEGLEICNALEATFIRLLIAAIATVIIVVGQRKLAAIARQPINRGMLKYLIPATALGTWLGIWFSQIAYNYSDVAVAQTLLSTCPLFAIPIVWLVYQHRVSFLSIIGTIVALVGVALVVQNS